MTYQFHYERNLPHFQPKDATLFVTFRLAGSLPKQLIDQLREETERLRQQIRLDVPELLQANAVYELQKRFFGRYDQALDSRLEDPHWLREPQITEIVLDSFRFWDAKRYDLICLCIMSNHVHVVLKPLQVNDEQISLHTIMKGVKGFSAREANKVLGRRGQFWHHESYDHVVRNEEELKRIVRYTLNNPVKSRLVSEWHDWKGSYFHLDTKEL